MSALPSLSPIVIFTPPTAKGDDARIETLKGGLAP